MRDKKENTTETGKIKPVLKSNLLLPLLLGFELFLVLIANSPLAGEDDLFWYLSTGRYIIETGSFPSQDVFGFTTSGSAWIPFEWGWDVINYGLFGAGEYFALNLFSTLIILLIFYLIYRLMQKLNAGTAVSVLFMVILALGMMTRFTVKPHLISYLALMVLLGVIVSYRYMNRENYKVLYFIPLIFVFWINMHMGVLAGFMLLGLYFAAELLGTLFPKYFRTDSARILKPGELVRLFIIIVISMIVTLLNPHGAATFEYAFHIVSMQQLNIIYEWRSPFTAEYLLTFSNFVYYFFILGIIPVGYYAFKKRDVFPVLVYAGFFLNSLNAVRLSVDFMLVTSVFLAVSVSYFLKERASGNFRKFIKESPLPRLSLIVLLAGLIITIPANYLYTAIGIQRTFGVGIDSRHFPVRMYNFIKEKKIDKAGERPFNTYETGGYFIWNFPEKQNFIGSRGINDTVWNQYTKILNMEPGAKELIRDLKIDYFALMIPMVNFAENAAILSFGVYEELFNNRSEWKLVYWDDSSVLFVKNEERFLNIISRNEYKYVTPYNFFFNKPALERGIDVDRITFLEEINRKKKGDPNGVILNYIINTYKDIGL
jgi:hypothetical protein